MKIFNWNLFKRKGINTLIFRPFSNHYSKNNHRFSIMFIPHSEKSIRMYELTIYGAYLVVFISMIFIFFILSMTIVGSKAYINSKTDIAAAERKLNSLNNEVKTSSNILTSKTYTINELQNKINDFNKILETQDSAVKAIFAQQEENNKKDSFKNNIISFVLGVCSSLVATIIVYCFVKVIKVKH